MREKVKKQDTDAVHSSTQPDGERSDVTVLAVRAVPEAGFHRAGRFWPHDVVHVFVSDDPEAQVPQDFQGNLLQGCVISTVDAARLKAEKMLIVTELKPVPETGAEDN
ncbi:hypothetical protein SAMN05428958_102528 [Pantoea sesami]|nr:hypothetical protein SAMN05428958_102528 [Pantoea sesami]